MIIKNFTFTNVNTTRYISFVVEINIMLRPHKPNPGPIVKFNDISEKLNDYKKHVKFYF